MESAAGVAFEDGEVAASFAAAREAVQAAMAAATQSLSTGDVLAAEQEWEHLHRLIAAAQIDNLAAIDTGRIHRIDGHRSVAAHTRHVLKVSPEEGARRAQAARALRALPDVATAAQEGRIGSCHVRVLAGVYDNPRIKAEVVAAQHTSSTGPTPNRSTSSRPSSSAGNEQSISTAGTVTTTATTTTATPA